jgi:predicted lactoylglutathione lyase
MIGYVTLGTNDIDRAAEFYDALLQEIGASRMMESEKFVAWSVAPDQPALSVTNPFDGKAASVGNGVMVALAVNNRDKVDALYHKAIDLGEVTRAHLAHAGTVVFTLPTSETWTATNSTHSAWVRAGNR